MVDRPDVSIEELCRTRSGCRRRIDFYFQACFVTGLVCLVFNKRVFNK